MRFKKYIIFAGGLLFLFIIVLMFLGIKSSKKSPSPGISSPTPAPQAYPTFTQLGDYGKLLEKVKNRPPIASSDAKIRSRLVSSLNGTSGTLYKTTRVQIDYIKSPDVFQVKILTSDIDSAKQDTVGWFRSEGLSMKGICNLPVMFYLDFSLLRQYPNLKNSFNPLPPGC